MYSIKAILFAPMVFLTLGAGPRESVQFSSESLGRWQVDGRRFIFSDPAKLLLLNKTTNLVMVSFNPGSSFAEELALDNRTLAYFSSRQSGIGRAVLSVEDAHARDLLAERAHADINVCGALEIIDPHLSLTTLGLPDAASPIIPTTVKSAAAASLLADVSSDRIKDTTLSLQNMTTRYHDSASPNLASDAIKSTWQSLLPSGATISQETHADSKQKSVILRIPSAFTTSETVVLGAHLDSIHKADNSNAPGADDDASGVAALTEIIRLIQSKGMSFKRHVEIHAYAAEEVGLIGSSDIAAKRKTAASNIVAMLQLDMIGYSSFANDETMHLITTDTSPVLVRHLKDLVSTYLNGTWKAGALPAGTSDHKSWNNLGYHAAFAFENPEDSNHKIHTPEDTLDRLSFTLAARFTKLALAFLIHEAGYSAAIADSAADWTAQQSTSSLIKLAAVKGSDGGDRLVAAVNAPAATVEFCKISLGTEVGCQSMVTDTALGKQKSDRSFFVSANDLSINANDLWRVSAYSSTGALLAMRRMRLTKN